MGHVWWYSSDIHIKDVYNKGFTTDIANAKYLNGTNIWMSVCFSLIYETKETNKEKRIMHNESVINYE